MNIDLQTIYLKLKWVDMRNDTTVRSVSLLQIAKMHTEKRKMLMFIPDFHPTEIFFRARHAFENDLHFTRLCDKIGYIHFSYTNRVGIFYEAVFETTDEEYFNAIRVKYYETIQELG